MVIKSFIVDSFTNEIFKGNPAGVCILENELAGDVMLNIAREFGFSETAFVLKKDDRPDYLIRFFSPKIEIPLCGHATLAAAKVMFHLFPEVVDLKFYNVNNLEIPIKRKNDRIELTLPIYSTNPDTVPDSMLIALGLSSYENAAFNQETNILIIEVDNVEILRKLAPDFERLIDSHTSINGVLITACSDIANVDFESRYFWPWSGTNEDPVTGATHTFLTKYWADRLGKTKMRAVQCSARSGSMDLEIMDEKTLKILCFAKIVLEGNLYLD